MTISSEALTLIGGLVGLLTVVGGFFIVTVNLVTAVRTMKATNEKVDAVGSTVAAVDSKVAEVHVMVNDRLDKMTIQVTQARDDLHAAMEVIKTLKSEKSILIDTAAAVAVTTAATVAAGTGLPVIPLTTPTILVPPTITPPPEAPTLPPEAPPGMQGPKEPHP